MIEIPRLVIAGTSSGVGKTSIAVGLIRALQNRGLKVAAFKCGPDYLDPTYLARAAGTPCHNLDGWMMGREAVLRAFARGVEGKDIAVIEGMMGLFDGLSPTSDDGSTAEIAAWLDAPVLLVMDASGMARSVAAIAHGFSTFGADVTIAGLVCNRVGGRGHLDLLRQAVATPTIVGGLPKVTESVFPERHLGLVRADAHTVSEAALNSLHDAIEAWCDLPNVLEIARSAPPLPEMGETIPHSPMGGQCRIGVAFDEGFHFYYDDNLRRLEACGATLVRFSPTHDATLPDVDGLYFGGGYPEIVADALSSNRTMREAVRDFAQSGKPMYAECGGLMYLCRGIRTVEGERFPMVGIIPGEAVLTDRIQAIGYVEVKTRAASILGPSGLTFRGHQFRYSTLENLSSETERIYSIRRGPVAPGFCEGYRVKNVVASYVHAHWESNPVIADEFVRSVRACLSGRQVASSHYNRD